MNYKTVPILTKRNVEYGKLTDQDMASIRSAAESATLFNKNHYIDVTRSYDSIMTTVQTIWGRDSNEYRYWREHKPPPPPDVAGAYQKLLTKVNDFRRKRQSRIERERAEQQAREQRNAKARETRARNKALKEQQEQWERDIQAD